MNLWLLNRSFAIGSYVFGLLVIAFAGIFMEKTALMGIALTVGLLCTGLGLGVRWYQERGRQPTARTRSKRAVTWLLSGALLILFVTSVSLSDHRVSHIANGLLLVCILALMGVDGL